MAASWSAHALKALRRQAAPRLARCTCLERPPPLARFQHSLSRKAGPASTKQTPFLKAFRSQSTTTTTRRTSPAADSVAAAATKAKASSFPETSDTTVGYWLIGSAVSVFGIVVFGGLTRLTESGLSITEWRPVTGTLPPLNAEKWTDEYDKYRASPEFKQLNPNMSLDEFKKIYFMEYTHRLWGRVIGLATLLPTVYFIARRRVSAPMARNLVAINLLIIAQGGVGWWMVKSGLKDDLFASGSHPRVSQYRLAVHLGMAFTVYSAMLWNGLQVLRTHALLAAPAESAQVLARLQSAALAPLRRYVGLVGGLVCVTVMSGALVAGLDAGLIYNEFPYMGLGLTPPAKELWDPFYCRDAQHKDLWWRNMLENPSLVQLDHRVLAVSTFTAVHALWAYARFAPGVRAALTRPAIKGLNGVVHLVWVQVALGLTTLLYLVPTSVAAAHQAGALALLTGFVVLGSRVWTPRRLQAVVSSAARRAEAQQRLRGPSARL